MVRNKKLIWLFMGLLLAGGLVWYFAKKKNTSGASGATGTTQGTTPQATNIQPTETPAHKHIKAGSGRNIY